MSASPVLFFVALLPSENIQREVTALKQEAAARFGSKHALKSPPHLTLVPPFRRAASELPALREVLSAAASPLAPFPVQLRGFDYFGGAAARQRVIFVDVVADEPLHHCQLVVSGAFQTRLGIEPDARPYHPHMTVAFKDLESSQFQAAWGYFSAQTYERTFRAEVLTLLAHNGQRWEVLEQGTFGKP